MATYYPESKFLCGASKAPHTFQSSLANCISPPTPSGKTVLQAGALVPVLHMSHLILAPRPPLCPFLSTLSHRSLLLGGTLLSDAAPRTVWHSLSKDLTW